ncbi:DUF4234 domain-containing protein [Pseudonocardia nematodicida]|uniref:DUF4234 domain-containing protein n=1 Tax=Pseudonocardia nematodicida TaxID=1206997 RepID=A0ABV1KAL2_9PSEU
MHTSVTPEAPGSSPFDSPQRPVPSHYRPPENGQGPQRHPAGHAPYGPPAGVGPQWQQAPRVDARHRPGPGAEMAAWRPGELSAPPRAATGLAMTRRNPVGVWLGLPPITFGIYGLVWYYKIHREMAEFDPRRPVPVAGPMLVLIFLGWTVVAPLVSFYNTGRRIADAYAVPERTPVVLAG